MKPHETQKYGHSLKQMEDKELDRLLASVLQEMRRRDSDHVKGDVINGTQQLRKLRGTSKLP
jgi:hypothetical protein